MRLTYNTVVYGGEPIADSIARLARYGYDGVEFAGEPSRFDVGHVRDLLARHGLVAASISGIFTEGRDLVHPESQMRKRAVEYIQSCADLAASLGAAVITVTPTAVMRTQGGLSREQDWKWAVEGLRAAGEYAGSRGVGLAVEPWNRYENFLINRVQQAVELTDQVGMPNVGCMADTFHMNIEESNPAHALRSAGSRLLHVQFADNTREAPGRGYLDFVPLVRALQDIEYSGFISFELFPAEANPLDAVARGQAPEFFDLFTEESIREFRRVLGAVQSSGSL